MKMFGHSLFYSRLVILTSFASNPDSLLSSEKLFSTSGDKITFFVFETQRCLFNCGLPSPSADRMTRY